MSTTPRPPVPLAGFVRDPDDARQLVCVADFERAAAERLAPGPLAYFARRRDRPRAPGGRRSSLMGLSG